MDIPPSTEPNGQTVVLFHGKAFGCYYFRNVIEALTGAGYRVVAPDQIGWGKSPKPDIHYSFQLLAANTAALLDHLGVGRVAVLGHSTGGMTATRFTLMNPDLVTHLVLEDPLGLADYRTGIPPQSEETPYQHELHWTDPAVIRGYVAGYFVHPDPKVWEPLARRPGPRDPQPRLPALGPGRGARLPDDLPAAGPLRISPIAPPVLLIVGAEDHVVPLGQYAPPAEAARLGDFVALVRRGREGHSPRHARGHPRLRPYPAPRTPRPVPGRAAAVPRELSLPIAALVPAIGVIHRADVLLDETRGADASQPVTSMVRLAGRTFRLHRPNPRR